MRCVETGCIPHVSSKPCIWGRGSCRTFSWLFLDGAQLYGFLGFFYRAVEIACWLWGFFISISFSGVHQYEAGVVVLIFGFHLFECLLVVLVAVEVYVISGYERGILPCQGRVFLEAAPGECGQKEDKQRNKA